MFKTNFSEYNTYWGGTKKFGGHCPRMPPWLRAWSKATFPNWSNPYPSSFLLHAL